MGIFKLHQRCAAFCNRRILRLGGVPKGVLKHNVKMWRHGTIFILLKSFAKLRKATVSFVMSVCPSAWNNSAPLDGFSWNFIFACSRRDAEKIQVSLQSDKSNEYSTGLCTFVTVSRLMFRAKIAEKIKTHLMLNNFPSKIVPFVR
jgi:hypothetical protein